MKRYRFLLWALLLLLLVAGIFGWRAWRTVFGPGPEGPAGDRVLLIPTGASFDQVLDSLRQGGFIQDEATFRLLAERKKYNGHVKPGRYVIPPKTSLNALVNKLRSGQQDAVHVTFTNIKNLYELSGRVAEYLEMDSVELVRAIEDPRTAERLGLTPETLISLFLPNTYDVWWTERPDAFLDRMAREYRKFWNEDRRARAKAIGLSQSEVSTLASIVQSETSIRSDAPIIAGVYLNRLRIGMPLQADPTLKYALGLDSLRRIWNQDMLVESPYNTYKYAGLPPGPISLPEPRYIDAVLKADRNDYLYFCAREDFSGYSNFAVTLDQHNANARRYRRALNQRDIHR